MTEARGPGIQCYAGLMQQTVLCKTPSQRDKASSVVVQAFSSALGRGTQLEFGSVRPV